MSAPRYLGILAVAVIGVFALTLAATLVVDPFGVSPLVRESGQGDGVVRPQRNQNDRLIKPYDPVVRPAGIVFLGTSRIKQGLDPREVREIAGEAVYNAGVDNGSLTESARLGDFYARRVPALRHLYVEIFAINGLNAHFEPIGAREHAANLFSLFLSTSAFRAAVETRYVTLVSRQGVAAAPTVALDGFYPVLPHPQARSTFERWVDGQWKATRLDFESSDALIPFLKSIRERASRQGVAVSFFLTPFHSWTLYGFEHYGNWHTLEKIKRDLAAVGGVYDFTRYNELIDERPENQMRYWFETWHFRPQMGKLMAAAMIDRSRLALPANFGAPLAPATIERDLAAFRAERDAWIARNGDVIARYRAAASAAREPATEHSPAR